MRTLAKKLMTIKGGINELGAIEKRLGDLTLTEAQASGQINKAVFMANASTKEINALLNLLRVVKMKVSGYARKI